jgi:hypothetical protein
VNRAWRWLSALWKWFLPIPATLVIGRDGLVKARFVDPDFRHRMGIEDFLGATSGTS